MYTSRNDTNHVSTLYQNPLLTPASGFLFAETTIDGQKKAQIFMRGIGAGAWTAAVVAVAVVVGQPHDDDKFPSDPAPAGIPLGVSDSCEDSIMLHAGVHW